MAFIRRCWLKYLRRAFNIQTLGSYWWETEFSIGTESTFDALKRLIKIQSSLWSTKWFLNHSFYYLMNKLDISFIYILNSNNACQIRFNEKGLHNSIRYRNKLSNYKDIRMVLNDKLIATNTVVKMNQPVISSRNINWIHATDRCIIIKAALFY